MTRLARSAAALAALAALGCGTSPEAAPAPAPPPVAVAPAPPPHPSGASPRDLEVFRWVGSAGEAMRTSLNDACGMDVHHCVYGAPEARPTCLPVVLERCRAAVAAARAQLASVPQEIAAGYAAMVSMRESELCTYTAVADAVAADPSMARRTRRRDRDWESSEEVIFRDADAGRRSAVAARERLDECTASEGDVLGFDVVQRWLRQRFMCATPHPRFPGVSTPACCTAERVGAMLTAGIEPGPAGSCR